MYGQRETNTCPRPQGRMLDQLIADMASTLADVIKFNPSFTYAQSVEWAIDGVSEGYELEHDYIDFLRDRFSQAA